jgi:hypothetical protein
MTRRLLDCRWIESWPGVIGMVIALYAFLWWLP